VIKGSGKNKNDQVDFSLRFNTLHIDAETLDTKNLFNNSGNDVIYFMNKLMDWFTETMDRCSGWYKRRLKLILSGSAF